MSNGKTKLVKPEPPAAQGKTPQELQEAAARKGKKFGPTAAGLKTKLAGGAQSKATAARELQQTQGNARAAATLGAAQQQQQEPPALAVETLIKLGVAYVERDAKKYGRGQFPDGYYETVSRYLFEYALKFAGGDYENAFWLMNEALATEADNDFHRAYGREVAAAGANGPDKVKHFVKVAYHYAHFGTSEAVAVAYAKEIKDELKYEATTAAVHEPGLSLLITSLLGTHTTGWDDEDIDADMRGLYFGIQMDVREQREEKSREKAREKSLKGGDLPPPVEKVEQQPAGQTKPPGQPIKIKT